MGLERRVNVCMVFGCESLCGSGTCEAVCNYVCFDPVNLCSIVMIIHLRFEDEDDLEP